MLADGSFGSSQNHPRVLPFRSTMARARAGPLGDAHNCYAPHGSTFGTLGTRQSCLERAKKPVAR